MSFLQKQFFLPVPELTPIAIIDILAVAFLIYQFFLIIRGRRAGSAIAGVLVLVAVYAVSVLAGLGLLRTVFETLAPYTVFALIVMFQSDIRRLLAQMGRQRWLSAGGNLNRREHAEEIALALETLSQNKIGALIVLERDIGLRTFIESGVRIDGVLSRDLLLSIFHPGTALHDGAVIVQGDRVAAAACFLPLSMNPRLMNTLGTRHRAAIGVTEEADCLALVVSEETGRLSVASSGKIDCDLSIEEVEKRIAKHAETKKKKKPQAFIPPGAAVPPVSVKESQEKEAGSS